MNSSQKKALENKIARLDAEVARLSGDLATIATRLEDSRIYEESRKNELKELLKTQADSQQKLELAEAEWLELSEKLES
jgi:ATP-binding cassette subfamily F protein 3